MKRLVLVIALLIGSVQEAKGGPLYNGPLYNGPLYNGPIYNGPMYNGPMYNGPMYNGPAYQGPGYTGAGAGLVAVGEVSLLMADREYHEMWINNPFNMNTLLSTTGITRTGVFNGVPYTKRMKDVLCNPIDWDLIHYVYGLSFDNTVSQPGAGADGCVNFEVECANASGASYPVKYNLCPNMGLGNSWASTPLKAASTNNDTTCPAPAKWVSAGLGGTLNVKSSVNATTDQGKIHNLLSARGNIQSAKLSVAKLYNIPFYKLGTNTPYDWGPCAPGTAAGYCGWQPGQIFKATNPAGAARTLSFSAITGSGKNFRFQVNGGIGAADSYTESAPGGISWDGYHYSWVYGMSPFGQWVAGPSISMPNAVIPITQTFSTQWQPQYTNDTAALSGVGIVASGSGITIQQKEHEILDKREGAYYGCMFGWQNRSAAFQDIEVRISSPGPATSDAYWLLDGVSYFRGYGVTKGRPITQLCKKSVTTSCVLPTLATGTQTNIWDGMMAAYDSQIYSHVGYHEARGCIPDGSTAAGQQPVCGMAQTAENLWSTWAGDSACSSVSGYSLTQVGPNTTVPSNGCYAARRYPGGAYDYQVITVFLNTLCDMAATDRSGVCPAYGGAGPI